MSVCYICMQDHNVEPKSILFTHKVQNTTAGFDMRAYRLILEAPWLADVEQALNTISWNASVIMISCERFSIASSFLSKARNVKVICKRMEYEMLAHMCKTSHTCKKG